MKTKMVAWKPICHEIFCFNLHSGQTLIFCCKSLTVKFDVKYLFTTWFLETITFVFMMSQSSSDKKHINMWYQIARVVPQTRSQICRIYTADVRLCPTYKIALQTPERRILHQCSGVTPSKAYYSNTRHQFCMNSALLPLRPILHLRKIPNETQRKHPKKRPFICQYCIKIRI